MRYCRHCNAKYFTIEVESCTVCGRKLAEGDAYPHTLKGKHISNIPLSPKALAVALFIIAIIAIAPSMLPTAKVTGDCREVEEQYLAEVPYETDAIYNYYPKYDAADALLENQWNSQLGFFYEYNVTLQNTDNDNYYYTVQYLLETSKHGQLTSFAKKLVKKGEKEVFSALFDTDLNEEADGKFIVHPEPVQKLGKVVKLENTTLTKNVVKCY